MQNPLIEEIPKYLGLAAVGLAVGVINVGAGGGSTLSLPALIFAGLEPSVANGTNRIAIILQNISAIISFRRQNVEQFGLSMKMGLCTVPGGIIGALFAVRMDNLMFKRILVVVMIAIVLTLVLPKPKNQPGEGGRRKIPEFWIYPAMFGIGFYGGFIQVGVGFILMAALRNILRLDLVYVSMHKVFIVTVYTIPVFIIFLMSGKIHWVYGLSLAVGNTTGAWWAAKLSVRKGEKVIRYILVAAITIMAIRLLTMNGIG